MRHFGWMIVVGAIAAWGCGDDDDSVAPAPSGKELQELKPVELRGLCEQLLNRVRSVSTPEQQCVEAALDGAETTSACDTARKSCLSEKDYQDYDSARCPKFEDLPRDEVPAFDCDTTVSEVTSCYERVAKWLDSLRCSQAGDAPLIPSCIDDLSTGRCKFGLSKLLTRASDTDAGSMSCQPKARVSCLCAGGGKGTQTCNDDGVFEPCDCTETTAECTSGTKSYPYDFSGSAECNECATQHCCASFVDCQMDTDCSCYWDCLGEGRQEDCLEVCKISDSPQAFVDHAVCLRDNCRLICDVQS
jgi:hypothetical protein